jgi:hypothetical protein
VRTQTDVLADYGLANIAHAGADGSKIKIVCSTGRVVLLTRVRAEKLAAELMLAGAVRDGDTLLQAIDNNE